MMSVTRVKKSGWNDRMREQTLAATRQPTESTAERPGHNVSELADAWPSRIEKSTTRPRVLVVEDAPDIRDLVVEFLSESGYVVDVATNGARALSRVATVLPDVILLDLMMPVMTGWEFCQRLRALPEGADVPVIVMSATHRVAQQASAAKATDYLAKPFTLDQLLAIVSRYAPLPRESLTVTILGVSEPQFRA
jgi:two-component system, chemotaxis family, chemotaxis protein CheY